MAVPAQAATTRADFVAQADPICQNGLAQEAVAIQPVIRAAKRVKKHHTRKAAKRFDRAFSFYFAQFANIERAVNAQIATVPVAPDDVSLIQVWLRARGELLDVESRLFLRPTEGKGLKGFAQVFNDLFELIGRQLEVSDLVRDFGFQYCTLGQPELQIIR
jgi:hypothetical protein